MHQVIFIILRRMRAPLLVLIVTYAIAILGLVVVPGVDADGRPWRMDIFHAFYFVSYMATTIGFGEIPHEFSAAQRMWTLVSMYMSVIAWLYAIGKILTLIQDQAFKQAVTESAFARGIRHINEPFYIICGYGDTGSLLVRALSQRDMRAVVTDINRDRINELELEDLPVYVPGLCADASRVLTLKEAGLLNPYCAGVVALTDDDQVNLKIAITTKLLRPHMRVITRAETRDAMANMASFGTDHIINPYDIFANRLALALHSPGTHLLYEWVTGVPETPLPQPLYPEHGSWVLCGFGRFGKAVNDNLVKEGIKTTIIEADPELTGCEGCVVGRGTEADTLRQAGIEGAVGIVAGTDNDTNNLSIIMTAKELNPKLFMVARQNRRDNDEIFHAANLDLVMQRSEIIAREILALLTTPLLPDFLRQIRARNNAWANEQVSRISAVIGDVVPALWVVSLDDRNAPVVAAMAKGESVFLHHLMTDHRDRKKRLECIALIIESGGRETLMPHDEYRLKAGDRVLFVGKKGVRGQMEWVLQNYNALTYVLRGKVMYDSYLWRWLANR